MEMCQYRTKCLHCKTVVKTVRSLLDEIADIKKNEVVGVCEHCKRANPLGKCRRCEFIVNKFMCNKVKQYQDRQNRFKIWINKVNQLLQNILQIENVCRHKLNKDTSVLELEKLLLELKSPLEMRQPDISIFPTEGSFKSMTHCKEILEELLIKHKSESKRKSSDDSLFVTPSMTATSCVCKYFMDKQFEGRPSIEVLALEGPALLEQIINVSRASEENVIAANKDKKEKVTETPSTKKAKLKSPNVNNLEKENVSPLKRAKEKSSQNETGEQKTSKGGNIDKHKLSPEEQMILKMMKDREKEKKQKAKSVKPEKVKEFAKVESLPELKVRQLIEIVEEKSESVIECDYDNNLPNEMIKGIKVIPLNHYKEVALDPYAPLLFNVQMNKESEITKPVTTATTTITVENERNKSKKSIEEELEMDFGLILIVEEERRANRLSQLNLRRSLRDTNNPLEHSEESFITLFRISKEMALALIQGIEGDIKRVRSHGLPVNIVEKSMKGILKYQLSNKEFIEKGLTVLPTTKVMRRMNIYKMEPANPKYDWFKRHKNRNIMFYDTCEKLGEIEETGDGKWYYKNGRVALDYYTSQDLNASQRYVVYSSGDEIVNGKHKPVTVLASFDFFGNGIVYDHYGNVRLKYNQSEGMLVDQKIGPPGRWKWHSLNDPPILQQVFVDTHVKRRDNCLDEILNRQKEDKTETTSLQIKGQNPEMLAIEFENFVKEKADKLLQKFKPFQIRMKALKLNDQFSLRVLDQSNIYLMFREGHVSLKLNLGMVLINSEIVDTDTSDVADVATPYDRIPPKSQSVAEIQKTLHEARRVGGASDANLNRNKSIVSKI